MVITISPRSVPLPTDRQFRVGDGRDEDARRAYRYVLPIELSSDGPEANKKWNALTKKIYFKASQPPYNKPLHGHRVSHRFSLETDFWCEKPFFLPSKKKKRLGCMLLSVHFVGSEMIL